MAYSIKLKFPALAERDILRTKRQYGNITAATSTTDITINTVTRIINTTTLATITNMPVKFSRNFGGEVN